MVLVILLMNRILHPVDPVRKSLMAFSPYQDILKKEDNYKIYQVVLDFVHQ